MKLLSETFKELGIDFSFPIVIKNDKGNWTYYEQRDGYWRKREFNSDGKKTYYENSNGYSSRHEYDVNGNKTYFENSNGLKIGTPKSQSCDGKVIEFTIDGKKYMIKELI